VAPIQVNQQHSEPTQCKEVKLRDQPGSNAVNDMIAEMIAADLVIEEQREPVRPLRYADFVAICRGRGFNSEASALREHHDHWRLSYTRWHAIYSQKLPDCPGIPASNLSISLTLTQIANCSGVLPRIETRPIILS